MALELICDHKTLIDTSISLADKCKNLAPICGDNQSTINFFELYFCSFNAKSLFFLLFGIIMITIIFKFICSVVEECIAPAIVYLSSWLGLSETLAGVTLIAFANGVGNVITAIVVSETPEGVSYNIGVLYGAGLFVLTFVIAMTIRQSPTKIIVNKSILFRDLGFNLIASAFIIFCGIKGVITWYYGLILLLIYVALVLVVGLQDFITKKKNSPIEDQNDEEYLISKTESRRSKEIRFKEIENKLTHDEKLKLRLLFNHLHNYMQHKKMLREENESVVGKFVDWLDMPFSIVRMLTIPPVNTEEYNHYYVTIWPFCGFMFLAWSLHFPVHEIWYFIIPVSALISLALYKFRPAKNDESPGYFIIIVILGILCGILWAEFLTTILIDFLRMIGLLTNLSSTYLVLTVIAIGNALPDALTTIAIARKGEAIMGITGGIAGQLLGILVGFGLAMIKRTLNSGIPAEFDIFSKDKLRKNLLNLIVIFFAILTSLTLLIYGVLRKYLYDRMLSNILLSYYGMFFIICTAIAIYEMFN